MYEFPFSKGEGLNQMCNGRCARPVPEIRKVIVHLLCDPLSWPLLCSSIPYFLSWPRFVYFILFIHAPDIHWLFPSFPIYNVCINAAFKFIRPHFLRVTDDPQQCSAQAVDSDVM